MTEINVLLVDDHSIFLEGMEMLLSTEKTLNIVGTATDAPSALTILKNLNVDVVLTDLNMPGMDGIKLIRSGQSLEKPPKFIALTMIDDSSTVIETLEAGADAYLLKNTSLVEIMTAIQAVMQHQSYVSPLINKMMITHLRSQHKHSADLTKRELEVLQLVAKGFTSRIIANELSLSIDTVKFHRKNLLSKLNQPNTASLVRYALDSKVVSL